MATVPNIFPELAAKRAESPDVAKLFSQLEGRAQELARLLDEYSIQIVRHREARTGKKFKFTKRQQETIEEFDRDAAKAREEMKKRTEQLDDATLLTVAIATEQNAIALDECMYPAVREEDKKMAKRIIDFQKETLRLIEVFVKNSAFKDKVVPPPRVNFQRKRGQ